MKHKTPLEIIQELMVLFEFCDKDTFIDGIDEIPDEDLEIDINSDSYKQYLKDNEG